jgi:hypothetical protein
MSKSNKIIKKKDLNKVNFKDDIEELVDADGDPIEGSDSSDNNTEVKTAPQQTTDDFVASSRQPNMNYYSAYGMGGGQYSRGSRRGDAYLSEKEAEIDESKQKMERMIEDIISKNKKNNDVVKKNNSTDVSVKEIPSINALKESNPEVFKLTNDLISCITKCELSGIDSAVVLNKLIDSISIEAQYKTKLKNKF